MLLAVIVVPKFGGYEDLLALHETVIDGTLDALTSFLLVLVIICSIEEPVTRFYGLETCQFVIF